MPAERPDSKSKRRADRAFVGVYHEAKLADLVEHVRAGLARYDAGEITAFDVDEIIHQYTLAARELWKFCDPKGSQVQRTASVLLQMQRDGNEPDWWAAGRRERS
ncbi:MAG: hypothetical protein WCC30_01720 [Candidatus Dormiibacterota bacterium]